ncbi:FAD-dependent monooxygenase [Streptomyces sp. 135]|uniref:FAD-dependent oxidoreductase n=1 Tax=Streptomyces sp. 135 TaxID=2838850 RepID=UPI001CBF8E9E|nr:FAD-dependent monooxygenase [Streptomyces sp. 135]
MPPQETDVLVVGAGPTGLALALVLRQAGLRVLVVERSTSRDRRTRAITLHAPTLEFLDALGLLTEVREKGLALERISFHTHQGSYHGPLTGLDSTVDGYLNLPQPVYEELLEEAARDSGVLFRHGTTYLGHSGGDRSPDHSPDESPDEPLTVRLNGAGGPSLVRCRYLIGCDGAGSQVRARLGSSLEGRHAPASYLLVEGTPLLPATEPETGIYVGRAGMVTLAPLPSGQVRVAGPADMMLALDKDAQVTADQVATLVDALGFGDRLRLKQVARVAQYTVQERIASRMAEGRVALAGDAAHLNAPAGGQGLNLGIGDVLDLAWRIVYAIRHDTAADMAGYESERREAAAEAIAAADVLPLVQRMRTAGGTADEETLRQALTRHAPRWSQLYPHHPAPDAPDLPGAYRLEKGTRVPTAVRETTGPVDLLPAGTDATLSTLLVAHPSFLARARDLAGGHTELLGCPPVGMLDTVPLDEHHPRVRAMWPQGAAALLVRPDRRVAAVLTADALAGGARRLALSTT